MDASYELLRAVFDRLKATAAVTTLVPANRIYDRAPLDAQGKVNAPFPYITAGPSTAIPDDFDCMYGEEITIQLDVWSSGPGEAASTAECRKICDAIKRALHDADDIVLTVNALVSLQWELTRVLPDPNPAIKHGVVQLTATIETP
jgi:hypothetical protein